MASSDTFREVKKEYEGLKENLQCAVCLDVLKKPVKILPCLHSFCSPCIEPVASRSQSSSKCPVCRREFTTSPGALSAKENHFLHAQIEKMASLRSTLEMLTGISKINTDIELCDMCDPPDREDASYRCLDCPQNLCDTCHRSHSKLLKSHKVIDISEEQDPASLYSVASSSSLPQQFSLCSQHPTQRLELFCIKCNTTICSHCIAVGLHKGHESTVFSNVADFKKSEIVVLIEEVVARKKDIETSLSLIDQMELKLSETTDVQKVNIVLMFDELKEQSERQIEERKQAILAEFEEKTKTKRDNLSQQRKQLETDLDCLENSVSVSRSIITHATQEQLAHHLPLISDQLGRLHDDKSFLQPPAETTYLDLTVGKQATLDDLLKGYILSEVVPEEIKDALVVFSASSSSSSAPSSSSSAIPPQVPIEQEDDDGEDEDTIIPKSRRFKEIKEPQFIVGRAGTEKGMFKNPQGVAVDNLNRIIVTDSGNNRVQIVSKNGICRGTFGSLGTEVGEFKIPRGITVDRRNNIFVTDGSRVQVFDHNGLLVRSFGKNGRGVGMFSYPQGITVNHHNNVLVCDYENHRVQILNDRGNFIKSFGTYGTANGQFRYPRDVAINQQGDIIVTDKDNHRVQVFDGEGKFIKTFGSKGAENGQFKDPRGVAIDRFNNIIVCDYGNNRVQVFDFLGKHEATFGTKGPGPGQFNGPSSVAVDLYNNIIVCDEGNSRIQVF